MYSNIYSLMRKFFWRGGQQIRQNLRELEHTQWFTRQDLEELQLNKMQRLVAYAYEHVPFYRKSYQREDIHPNDIKSFKDFHAIPFLTRDDVNNHLDSLVSKSYQGEVYEDRTGGSTGHPMRFFMDRYTALWSAAVEIRCRGWYGVRLGDKRAWVWGNQKDFPSWHWKERLGAHIKRYRFLNAHTMVKPKMQAFAEMLVKWRPVMFRAYPSALSVFANFLKEEGINGISPKLIETSAEKVTPDQRHLFEEVFGAQIADHYSSWEIYDIAYQCPEGKLHVCEDRYLELVANGKVVGPGQMGEVVITSLNQYAMPFIRYIKMAM
jgi:phenylacetate-CoA ligase